MRTARRFDTDHLAALSIALCVHAAIGTWAVLSSRTGDDAIHADALQVTWIEPTPPVAPPVAATPEPATTPRPANPAAPRRIAATAPAASAEAEAMPTATPEPSRPLSAVFIEQGKAVARGDTGTGFTRNPLTATAPTLGDTSERIRMREAMTAAKVVAGIGQIFGGPGYTTNPCPRIRRNIAALGTGGDSELLQEEVRRHRQFCE